MTRSILIRGMLVAACVGGLVAVPHLANAQRAPEQVPKFFTKLWQSDSLDISFPELSPDGRWIVFGTYGFGRSNLYAIPANGGTPVALTTGAHVDGFPRWFPSGDKIAFVSDRVNGIMVLGFDGKTGHAIGAPRRVTLEKADRFAISSTGDHIAFITEAGPGRFTVRSIPASGGPSTALGEIASESVPLVPAFSSDDRYILISTTSAERGKVSLVRVPAAGGATDTVIARLRGNLYAIPVPARQQVLQSGPRKGFLIAFSGDTNAVFDLGSASALQPTRDGLSAFATSNKTVAPVRMVRSSGETRNLSPGRGYDWPYAWSPDGKRVVYSLGDPTGNSSGNTWDIEEVAVDGTNRRTLRLRPTNISLAANAIPRNVAFTPDLRYAAFLIDSLNRSDALTMVVVDLQTGTARQITSRADRYLPGTANGNWYATNHGEFLYAERSAGQLNVRGAKSSGETRLIRSVPADVRVIAVEGDDIAFVRREGDSTAVLAAHGPNGDAKVVARLLGRIDELSWSPDAKWIAATIYGHNPANKADAELAFIPVAKPAQARFVATGNGGYEPVWTRDGSAVLYLKADKGWTQMSVWRYPLRADAPADNLTKNETSMIWGYVPSPDGSAILIPPERSKGMTLWRIDLQQATAAYRASRGQ